MNVPEKAGGVSVVDERCCGAGVDTSPTVKSEPWLVLPFIGGAAGSGRREPNFEERR